jgi:hypothetical protein
MAFPGVCAFAAMGSDATDAIKAINANVENVVREKRGIRKRRIFRYLLQRTGGYLTQRKRRD